jgi:hypothetical protein
MDKIIIKKEKVGSLCGMFIPGPRHLKQMTCFFSVKLTIIVQQRSVTKNDDFNVSLHI